MVLLWFYVPWKDSSGEDPKRGGFLGYDWRSNRPHGTYYIARSVADIMDPLALSKFRRAQVEALLADKPTGDLHEILGDSLSDNNEDDLLYIQFDGTEKFSFDEEQYDATGALPPFSHQPHRLPRDMLLIHAHPDYLIIGIEEACVAALVLFGIILIHKIDKPIQPSLAVRGVQFDTGGFDFEAFEAASVADSTVPQKVEPDGSEE
jgi:hypothetical protein